MRDILVRAACEQCPLRFPNLGLNLDADGILSVVSGPRNQRYLLKPASKRGGLLAVRRQRKDAGKIAGELDLEPAVLRHKPDPVDARAGPRRPRHASSPH